MLSSADFKTPAVSDSFKNKVYAFDEFIRFSIRQHIHLNTKPEMLSSNPNFDKLGLTNIKSAVDLTNKVLEAENIKGFGVSISKQEYTSTCYFDRITFGLTHINNEEVAFHEMAHLFESIFCVKKLPSHHVSFLATLEYLLDKYDFLSKSIFKKLVKIFVENTGKKLPYIEDFFIIKYISYSDYLNEVASIKENKEYISLDAIFKILPQNLNKVCFEHNDHYINFVINSNTEIPTVTKVIQKKLPYEKKQKEYDLIISPKYMGYKDYFGIEQTTNHYHKEFNAFAICINSKYFNSDILEDIILKIKEVEQLEDFFIQVNVKNDNCLVIGIRDTFKTEGLMEIIFKTLKQKRISYYKTKNKKEFKILDKNKYSQSLYLY